MIRRVYPDGIGILFLILLLIGIVTADVLPPNAAETQGIDVSTGVDSSGFFSHVTSLRWDLSSEILGANVEQLQPPPAPPDLTPEPPLNSLWEVQMRCMYHEHTEAYDGSIEYRRFSRIETQANPGFLYNSEHGRSMTFDSASIGRILSTEDTMVSTVGTTIDAISSVTCPLGLPCGCDCIPPFCNQIETGSLIDMRVTSMTTMSGLRNVNLPGEPDLEPPMPGADDPTLHGYRIRVTGPEPDEPARGIVSAYAQIHSIEGGGVCPGAPIEAQEHTFWEYRNAEGEVSLFSYLVSYESGLIR